MEQHDQRDGQWFIFKGEQHRGPYKTDEMVNLFALGVIGHKDLVWREGGGTWLPFADHAVFREIIFKEGAEEIEEERPPIEVPLPSLEVKTEEAEMGPPDLPPVPDEVDIAIEEDLEVEEVEEPQIFEAPPTPVQEVEEDKTSPGMRFEDAIIEEDEESHGPPWGKIAAAVSGVVAIVVSGMWLLQFRLQTYELIGLETANIEQFNALLLEHKGDHLVRTTKDGNVIWAGVPDIIEAEAYLKIDSINGRVLSTEPLQIVSQGEFVQGLVPFKRFTFESGERWVPGEYNYQLDIRPKGPVTRLASILAPYPWFNSLTWVKTHSRGHSFSGKLTRYSGSANNFEEELEDFKVRIWASLSRPLENRIEKYTTLKNLAEKTRELWFQRLGVAVTWRAFKKYDAGYGRDIAPVLQNLIVDSIKTADASREKSPLVARLYEEIEETGKQLGELASVMSASSKAVRRFRRGDKERLTAQFEELWQPLITKIDSRLASLKAEQEKLQKAYKVSE